MRAKVVATEDEDSDEDDITIELARSIIASGENALANGDHKTAKGSFMEALSWGDADCASDPLVRGHRTAFLGSSEFARLLRKWRLPPRSPHSHRSRPLGGRAALDSFALETVMDIVSQEMQSLDPYLRATGDLLTRDDLKKTRLDELVA